MRNGNFSSISTFRSIESFLSYLWGMETDIILSGVIFLPSVLILPMRNGNTASVKFATFVSPGSYPTYEEWKPLLSAISSPFGLVLILPMRNGNSKSYPSSVSTVFVLILPMRNGNVLLHNQSLYQYPLFLSYLWGMETKHIISNILSSRLVLILPMRNGNSEVAARSALGIYVLILPMRNGNAFHVPLAHDSIPVLILPMRNGNVSYNLISPSLSQRSYPTYEEWKPNSNLLASTSFIRFLSYLWGMETFLYRL